MIRNACLAVLGSFVLVIAGCGARETTPPPRTTSDIPDAELQVIEEDEHREREQEAQTE
jgi:hypothetical protein